ncbi:MAG TPA: hypothetical protein VH637_00220 [Streptosporangiaceae bacterium]|jgi:outer membrane lipoprotein-sorting protein
MTPQRSIPRLARWAVPAGAVALTGIVVVGYAIAGVQAAPSLPARTPVQLIASINSTAGLPPLTATVQETAALGLPSLPGNASDQMSVLSWLSGTHTARIWYSDPAHVRVAVPVQMGESDVRRDGRDVWFWDSQHSQATHVVLPSQAAGQPGSGYQPDQAVPSPQQAARQVLKAVGPTTRVGLQQNVMIAGQPAYQLSLTPKDSRSLIGEVRIAVDANRPLPLRLQVFARGASSPAFQVGYTSLRFGQPDPANFAFTPPPGAKVKTVTVPSHRPVMLPGGPAHIKAGQHVRLRGLPVSPAPPLQVRLPKQVKLTPLPKGAPKMVMIPGQAAPGVRGVPGAVTPGVRGIPGPGLRGIPGPLPGAPQVLGKDWLTVLAIPAAAAPLPAPRQQPGSGTVVFGEPRPGGSALAVLGDLLRASTPVHGSWGSGRLLTTSLVSVLATSDGTVLIGAVKPSVLYADAAQVK